MAAPEKYVQKALILAGCSGLKTYQQNQMTKQGISHRKETCRPLQDPLRPAFKFRKFDVELVEQHHFAE
jgi:hypothetical protein